MTEEQNRTSSYRSIFKSISLFGGVQVFQILIGLIGSKFVAVLLGPQGMGIQGLYHSAIQLIHSFSSFGLSQSAVRDVSEANGSGDKKSIGLIVAVVKRLVWITGLLGLVLTVVFSPFLSKFTFGNYDYTLPFIILSVILLLDQLCAGQNVILQGMRKLKFLAKSSVIGSSLGLLISVPLYFLFGINGIVPTLILNSLTMLLLSWYFSKKVDVEKTKVTNRQTFQHGKTMMKMGLAMSVCGIMVTLTSYALRSFIRHESGVEQVGLFSAGFALMNTYVGMVFNAMATDFYPRLSSVNQDNETCCKLINNQGEIATLIIAPMLVLCMIFMPFVVRIVYSDEFLPAVDYILWAVLGMMFKTFSWVIAFYFLAKAESKLFIINETITNIYSFVFSILGYSLYGIAGVGMAFVLTYLFYSIQVYIIAKKRYGFSVDISFKKIYLILLLLVSVVFLLIHIWQSDYVYIPTIFLFLGCSVYSLRELNKRIEILKLFKRKK